MTPDPSPDALQNLFQEAVSLHRMGRLDQAEKLYRQLAAGLPDSAAPRHMLGMLCLQQGRAAEALELIEAALAIDPANPDMRSSQGHALRALGRFPEAVAAYDKALAARPVFTAALVSRGLALRQLNRRDAALADFDKALAIAPRDAGIWLNHGLVLSDMARFAEALASYDKALAISPGHTGVLNNRALTLSQMGRFEEALASFDASLAAHPGNWPGGWEVLNNRGLTLSRMGRFEEALASHQKALALNPRSADVLHNRAVALVSLERFEEALADFQTILAMHPGHVGALNGYGLVLSQLGRAEEALASFNAALVIEPGHADALVNRAKQLLFLNRLTESLADHERLFALRPGDPWLLGGLAELALHLCDWPRQERLMPEIKANILAGKPGMSPFFLLGLSDDPALQLRCAKLHVAARLPAVRSASPDRLHRNDRIKVAYLSADFREHPTAYLMAELFERHDRSRFEVLGVSFGEDDGSAMRARLVRAFDQFIDVRRKSDREIAEFLKAQKVDIAIDLKGHTQNERLAIFGHRPAPLQVAYLGYPGTTGADFIDYVIADRIVAPFTQQQFFSEKIVQLPDCYQVNDSKRAIAAGTPSRKEAGLPDQGFVFCGFHSHWKISRPVFEIWMRLLKAVPGSVLWLMEGEGAPRLRDEAAACGVDPSRLVFAPRMPLDRHLARQRLADLFLDTLPCNAHTTASDALWAGLPLVTCKGGAFAGRVAASLLDAIGLPELATDTLADYEALILKLARDDESLRDLRARLEQNRLTYPLFDTDRFRRNIEAAYIRMWEMAGRGEPPQSFRVGD
jgi:predicted O-linked N-acetylglucosamine transferase (SPINDLY family)